MAFVPFGYHFEVRSPRSASDVKARIRKRWRKWFDAPVGARGWILGPYICLWFSVFDQQGPMVWAKISDDGQGTRIAGRAGSDLNGIVMGMVWIAVLLLIAIFAAPGAESAFYGGVSLLLLALILWTKHLSRRDADPLMRFLRDVAAPDKPRNAAAFPRPLFLTANSLAERVRADPDAVRQALRDAGSDCVVIVEEAPEKYIQAINLDGEFRIEMREGDHQRHFRASRHFAGRPAASKDAERFDYQDSLDIFTAWAVGTPMPAWLRWERMEMPH